MLETAIPKSIIEFRAGLWLASLHLRKVLDRVEWNTLLEALGAHGLPREYHAVIALLYKNQVGIVPNANPF